MCSSGLRSGPLPNPFHSASMSLRHPAFVRWSVYIEECLDVLSSDAQALPSDAWLCDLVRLQHIAEDASVMFSMDDPGSLVTLNDPKTRYQIGVFRQQLEHWRRYCKTDRTQRKMVCRFNGLPCSVLGLQICSVRTSYRSWCNSLHPRDCDAL